MKKGTVQFFNESKGYGFIKEDESGKDYFVSARGLADRLNKGDKVNFDFTSSPKGLNAINVKKE